LVEVRVAVSKGTFDPQLSLAGDPLGVWTSATFDCSVTLDQTGYLAQGKEGLYKETNTRGRFRY
jgi:hypothetical protein